MATTPTGAALTETYRRSGLALAAATTRDLLVLWAGFDLDDIDASWRRIIIGLMPLIEQRHALSSQAGAAYYTSFRAVEAASGTPTLRLAAFDAERVRANLELVGPIYTKKALTSRRPNPVEAALVRVAGETSRAVLDGGRQTVSQSVLSDPQALGWARATDGDPCAFCAMLAGRGAVYSERGGGFQAHSHCACAAEPVYSRTADRPGRGQEFSQLWNESTSGLSGDEARIAFRRAYEGR